MALLERKYTIGGQSLLQSSYATCLSALVADDAIQHGHDDGTYGAADGKQTGLTCDNVNHDARRHR